VFALALWAQPIGAMAGAFFDDGIYLTLAEALAMGEGYRNVHLPGAPPAVHHPLLYSLALSVLWRLWPVFPDNMTLFQLFDAAALAGAAWIIAAHAKRWSSPAFAQYIALPLGFMAFPLLNLVGMRFAEPLYLLLWAGAVAVADRDATTYRSAVVAGALAGLATLARSVGITIVAGVALALAIRKRPRQAISAAVAGAVTTAPWLVWTALQGSRIDTRIGPAVRPLRPGTRGLPRRPDSPGRTVVATSAIDALAPGGDRDRCDCGLGRGRRGEAGPGAGRVSRRVGEAGPGAGRVSRRVSLVGQLLVLVARSFCLDHPPLAARAARGGRSRSLAAGAGTSCAGCSLDVGLWCRVWLA
jgi:hypothetical protein